MRTDGDGIARFIGRSGRHPVSPPALGPGGRWHRGFGARNLRLRLVDTRTPAAELAPIEPPLHLLEPSLTEADDAIGFVAPWDPRILLLLVVVCGPIGGGGLMVWNESRLGIRGRMPWMALGFIAIEVGAMGLRVAARTEGWVEPDNGDDLRLVGFLSNVVAVLFAAPFARRQRHRFHVAEMADQAPGRLFGWGLLALAVNFGMLLVLRLLWTWLLTGTPGLAR